MIYFWLYVNLISNKSALTSQKKPPLKTILSADICIVNFINNSLSVLGSTVFGG